MARIPLLVLTFMCLASLCWSKCEEVLDTTVSDDDIKLIVERHNEHRLNITNGLVSNQPKGTNLMKLTWDKKLAAAAQNISNTCEFKHVQVDDSRFWVGQNLYQWMSTGPDDSTNWRDAIDSWCSEHKLYQYPESTSFSGTGHYTQVVWATTQYVGCGYTYYKTHNTYKYTKLYTCNYGPGGNMIGQAPYLTTGNNCPNLC